MNREPFNLSARPARPASGVGRCTLVANGKCTLVANGKCTLVGAGPGDPDLLTLKAVKAIQAATVLLVDDLVSDAVLAYASPTARVVQVGKREIGRAHV